MDPWKVQIDPRWQLEQKDREKPPVWEQADPQKVHAERV